MIDYPKMLYKGSIATYITIEDEHEEQAALQAGYVDYADLPQSNLELKTGLGVDLSGYVPIEQFDALGERIAELESANHILVATNEGLQARISDYEARLQEAVQRVTDQTQAPADTDSQNTGQVDYSEWTNSQLQKAIVDAGKTYNKRDSKAELIAILQG